MYSRDVSDDCNYICTHVDNFKVIAKDTNMWVDRITSIFLRKECRARIYYLDDDYTYHDTEGMWTYGCQIYATI